MLFSRQPLAGEEYSGATGSNGANCCCGGVDIECCPNDLPAVLYLTITNSTCSCLNGTHTLTYNAATFQWEGSTPCSPNTVTFEFACAVLSGAQGMKLFLRCSTDISAFATAEPSFWDTAQCSPPSWIKTGVTVSLSGIACCSLGQTFDVSITS